MIYLRLFWQFLEVGLFTFGGGYAMIALIFEKALAYEWLTQEELLNMIAISESTPGPIAVNMATFVGASQGGVAGALVATLGVVLPSFLAILLIAAVLRSMMNRGGVQAFLSGVRPCVIALILSMAVTLFLSTLLGIDRVGSPLAVDYKGLLILFLIAASAFGFKKLRKKSASPILLILISAGLGMLLYSLPI